jgi:hypothetical protein
VRIIPSCHAGRAANGQPAAFAEAQRRRCPARDPRRARSDSGALSAVTLSGGSRPETAPGGCEYAAAGDHGLQGRERRRS